MTNKQREFIETVYKYLCKHAPKYNIRCYSAIIAQAICESGWNQSLLSSKYNNLFGMKCGSSWNGKSVNLKTFEEYNGKSVSIRDNFRVYDSIEDGIIGYLEFINTPRYSNLRGISEPLIYLTNIKNDGYATSSSYVNTNMNIIRSFDLMKYNSPMNVDVPLNEVITFNEMVQMVIDGKMGNYPERKTKVELYGFNYSEVQAEVNRRLKPKKSIHDVALSVIRGDYGNGQARIEKLTNEGWSIAEITSIQQEVNRILKK